MAHGLTSPLNASLELSRRLRRAGHDVTYLSHADVAAEVENHGFAFVQLTDQDEVRKTIPFSNPIDWFRRMRTARTQSIRSTELEDELRSLNPDLLLIDLEMHYPVIATAALGIPTMLVMNFLSIFRLPGLPPLNSSLLPGDHKAIERAWRRVRLEALGARIRHKLGKGAIGDVVRPVSYGTRFYADLRQVAKQRGYPLRANTDRKQWLRPFSYTLLPVLCLNASELEFPHEHHPNIRYVGPMVNKNRPERRVSPEDRERWDGFVRSRNGEGRPLIYCSLGSYWSDRDFLRMVLAAFAERPQWDLVLGLGGQATPGELGPVPDNVLLLDYAPQLDVLAKADCAITHGGLASVNECIACEVPMIVYPPGLLDQDGNAARIDYHNLGVRGDWNTWDSADLARRIEYVLGNRHMTASIGQMRTAYESYEENDIAVRVIEQYLPNG